MALSGPYLASSSAGGPSRRWPQEPRCRDAIAALRILILIDRRRSRSVGLSIRITIYLLSSVQFALDPWIPGRDIFRIEDLPKKRLSAAGQHRLSQRRSTIRVHQR